MTGAVLLVCDVRFTGRRCVLYAGIYGRPDRLHPDQTRRRVVATAQQGAMVATVEAVVVNGAAAVASALGIEVG